MAIASNFFVSIGSLIYQWCIDNKNKRKQKIDDDNLKKLREELISDPLALPILKQLLENHPHATYLPCYNQKVVLLQTHGLIAPLNNMSIAYVSKQMSNPTLPYVLEPIAEYLLNEQQGKTS